MNLHELNKIGLKEKVNTKDEGLVFLYVQGDTNNGDYVESYSKIKDVMEIKTLLPIINKITENDGDWPYDFGDFGDSEKPYYLSQDKYNIFSEYTPYGEYGIHTIVDIRFFIVTNGMCLELSL